MENWGLVTYREVDLLVDPVTASASQRQRVCTVVTHELAHQWFGNLVTMAWWSGLWLNESFACFMQVRALRLPVVIVYLTLSRHSLDLVGGHPLP